MRYFDRILTEALDDKSLQNEIEKLAKKCIEIETSNLSDLEKDKELEKLRPRMYALRKDNDTEKYDKYIEKYIQHNPHYKKAAERMARAGDPLLLWMLKHLVSKTEAR